ncbi:MAG TPA: GGDEF domain-containing protein [Burkholderiales bacterium]|nr:GGDEF domain-containing protein [Burkholderiales bacterium]
MLEKLDRVARRLQPAQIIAAALALLALIGVADRLTGFEISLTILYLAPIGLATWYAGRAAGLRLAVIAALVWLAADLSAGHRYSHPLIVLWNTLMRIGMFVIVADLLATVKAQLAAARDAQALTLAYIDVDDLKQLNDRDGHDTGDRALQVVARTLGEAMRRTDTAARLGGDEFAQQG